MQSKLGPKQPSQSGLDLAGAGMTASTVAGSRAIAAKVVLLDPTSFKFLRSDSGIPLSPPFL